MILHRFSTPTVLMAIVTAVAPAQAPDRLLGGFDDARIADLGQNAVTGQPPDFNDSDDVVGEWARLIFQMRRLSDDTLRAQSMTPGQLASFTPVDGRVVSVGRLSVSEPLAELLDLNEVVRIGLRDDDGGPLTLIAPPDLPPLRPGDRLWGAGLVVRAQNPKILAAGPLRWDPVAAVSAGLESLRAADVDLAAVRQVAALPAVPLGPVDTLVFYPAISAAKRAGDLPADQPPRSSVRSVTGVQLLGGPPGPALATGDWISTTLTMIRATRVGIQSPDRQAEAGGDHFWQIDAISDLGNVRVDVQRPVGEPVRVGSRTPVSIVAATLPQSLLQTDPGALVLTFKRDLRVEGYFYRRWSYDSDLMDAAGGGRQVAPLLIAGHIEPIVRSSDPAGVRWVGYAAAGGGLTLLLFGVGYGWFNSAADRRVKRVR